MLQKDVVGNKAQMDEKLLELKKRLHNPEAAEEVRNIAKTLTRNREPFDVSNYERYLQENPSFSYLHLIVSSEE